MYVSMNVTAIIFKFMHVMYGASRQRFKRLGIKLCCFLLSLQYSITNVSQRVSIGLQSADKVVFLTPFLISLILW